MKIVIAVHHFPPRYTSGADLRAYRTAARLRERGHDASVICVESIDAGPGLTFVDDVYAGLAVRRLSFDLAGAPDPFRWSFDNPWIEEHLRDYLAELAPDLLHLISGYLMSGSTLRAAADLGIPTVLTLTDFWFLCPRITLQRSNGQLCTPPLDAVACARCLGEEKRRYRIPGQIAPALANAFWTRRKNRVAQVEARTAFLRERLKGIDALISPSQFLRNTFIEAGVSAERIIFSRQGRDFPSLKPELLDKPPAAYLRVGYMGQIAPHKGVHTLFEAVQQLPGAALDVKAYGDTAQFADYTRRLQKLAAQDSRLKLAGVYQRTEITQVLQGLDVVVVPSLWYENSPNVILEAFAHRTPVIASRLGGMAELVREGENGLLFKPGDVDDLARQLQRLLDAPHLLTELRAGDYQVKSVAQEITELEEIYQRVTSNYHRTEKSPQVTIIILNWNGRNDTLECLESLAHLDYPDYKVIVVDNGSTDGSPEAIRAHFGEVTLIENKENLGFAQGNNVGLRHALDDPDTDYVLLLNNDTIVDAGFLTELIQVMQTDARIGMASPLIFHHDTPDTIWSAGAAINWADGSTQRLGVGETEYEDQEVFEVDFVSGCALLAKRELLEVVGLLDPAFYLYYEETDWCVRAHKQGYRIACVPRSTIWHKVSRSIGVASPQVSYYMTRNSLLFLRKNLSGSKRVLSLGRNLAQTVRSVAATLIKRKDAQQRANARAKISGMWDFVRGRFGAA